HRICSLAYSFFERNFTLRFSRRIRSFDISGVTLMGIPSFGNPLANAKAEEKVLRGFAKG
ncbi:MAG: hypothetical protein QFX40_08590, partial [Archaeoglobales archaeon]|nr:hypothetical protein [Archaeoglobales archaeon]